MRLLCRVCGELGTLVAVPTLAIPVTLARAQTSVPLSPERAAPAGDMTGGMVAVAVMIALFAVIGVVVRALDLKRKRSDKALVLEARIADALLRDPALGHLPVTATAHAPLWRGSPMTIEVGGQVPTPALREAAINLVLRETCVSQGVQFRIEDRMTVVPSMARAA